MNLNQFSKIISPVLPYIIVILLYFNFRVINDFDATKWNWYLGSLLMFVTPIILLVWFVMRYRNLIKIPKNIDVFLISLIPGLFPGGFLAYGFWQMGHGKYLAEFMLPFLQLALPSALIFGVIGLLVNTTLSKFKSSKH